MWSGEVAVFFNFINIDLWRVELLLVFGTVWWRESFFFNFNYWVTAELQKFFTYVDSIFIGCIHLHSTSNFTTNKLKYISINFSNKNTSSSFSGCQQAHCSFNFFSFHTSNGAKVDQALSHSELCKLYHLGG